MGPQRTCNLWTKLAFGLGAAALLAATAGTATAAESVTALKDGRVMITDFSGKPPFKRRVLSPDDLATTELARFEEVDGADAANQGLIGEQVRVVDFRGKPPFKRRVVEIDASNVTELARFEPVSGERADAPARPRFPGKPFPLRRGR